MNDHFAILVEALEVAKRTFQSIKDREDRVLKKGIGAYGDVTYKIDSTTEEAILKTLRKRYPNALIISEESGIIGKGDGRPIILLDPVDGSTNALRGVQFSSTALAIAEGRMFDDIIVAGVIDLYHGDIITGTRDGPVLLNGKAVQPSTVTDLAQAYISMDLKIRERIKYHRCDFERLFHYVKHVRAFGTAALETAHVATGRVDAFIEPQPTLRSFDCIPSLFLVKRAGGFIKFLSTEPIDLLSEERISYVAACNEALGNAILKTLWGAD
ncbi:MAG: inositol monophosphatase [Nitrososphaerota archaeon]|nr:inositol monophosphatase [Nitrososphaerales archaeon]MCX8191591.1 inositol monophosphatase [Nitrososphaerales archaeon]MDW8044969.1 inositol monophosphatase [Nitrososphaerota archaeon]